MIDSNDWDIEYRQVWNPHSRNSPLNSVLWTAIQRCGLMKMKTDEEELNGVCAIDFKTRQNAAESLLTVTDILVPTLP